MGFFERLFEFLSGNDRAETRNKKFLKKIAVEIKQSRYRKFYKPISGEITPAFGSFFYDIYKIARTAQGLMKNAAKSDMLKQIVIEAFMDKDLSEINKRLSLEAIEEQFKTTDPQELSQQVEKDLAALVASFGVNRINLVDRCYNLVLTLIQFVMFDFFSLLKKCDPQIQEYNVNYQPQFRPIRGRLLVENIQDFLELSSIEATEQEWRDIFEVLKGYKNSLDVVGLKQWKKMVFYIQDIQRSDVLVLMVRHITKNPKWQRKFQLSDEYIVESYLKKKQELVKTYIDKIINNKRTTERDALANLLFGDVNITRLNHYTHRNNENYVKRNVTGFLYIDPLNYLKAFLGTYHYIQELCDLFLIRGQWVSQELSVQMAKGLHTITDVSQQLSDFDDSLSDEGERGDKLKKHLVNSSTDKNVITHLKTDLAPVNDLAYDILYNAVNAFTLVGQHFKALYEDYKKTYPELLINWKEVETTSQYPIAEYLENSCKIITDFVRLLQLFTLPE